MIIFDTELLSPENDLKLKNALKKITGKIQLSVSLLLNFHLLLCFCAERAQQGHPEAAEALQLR